MEGPALDPGQWTRREQLLAGTVVLAGGILALRTGLSGGLLGVVVVGTWLVAGTPYAFVIGQVGLVAFLDGGPTTTPMVQAALVVPLLLDATGALDRRRTTATVAVGAVATAVLLALDAAIEGVIRSGIVILVLTAVAAYAVHRYEQLELGLIGEPE